MAPEALRGEITAKSDIYSFGVVRFTYITSNNNHSGYNCEVEVEYFEYTCVAYLSYVNMYIIYLNLQLNEKVIKGFPNL